MLTNPTTNASAAALPVEKAYDLSAPFYDNWKWQSFWHRTELPIILETFARFRRGTREGLHLLDIGCGTGWYMEQLSPLCAEEVGIDLSEGMLAVARHRLPGKLLVRADARSVPFPALRFNAILCTRVLSHLAHPRVVLSEMRRLLVPGGLLIISNVDARHEYDCTRLPVRGGHVLADTFKHDRENVVRDAEELGFIPDASFLIFGNGSAVQMKRRRVPGAAGVPVGWLASWRRPTA